VHYALQILVQLKVQERIRLYRGKLRSGGREIGGAEGRSRATRLVKQNEKLFKRLA
jgi:hypothetical protein